MKRVEGFILLVAGVWALGFQLWLPSTHVAESDYQAVAQTLTNERQPGDVVLLAPWWTERARIYVPEGLPVVGYIGSDGDALERHPRIWVLSEPRLPRAGLGDFEKAFLPQRSEVGSARQFGNLRLQLFTNGRYRPGVLEGADALPSAQVYLESPDGQRQPCNWDGRGHRCGNGKTVAREWHDVHFAPYECVRMDAPGGPNREVVEFVSPGAGTVSLSAGFPWEYGTRIDAPVPVTLEIDGRPMQLVVPARSELMHRLDGGAVQAGSRIRVAVQADRPNDRVVCVTLRVAGGAP